MARVLVHHPGRLHWHAPTARFWHMLALALLWLVIISLGLVLMGSIIFSVVTTLSATPYFQGGGGMGAAMPLSFLATFMSAVMMPLFMPLALPVLALAFLITLPFDQNVRCQGLRLWEELTSASG